MDGENNGKPHFLMDDLGGKPTIFGNIHNKVGENICIDLRKFKQKKKRLLYPKMPIRKDFF